MKRSARHALNSFVAPGCTNTPNYFARRSSGKGQEEYSLGRDSALEQEFDSGTQCGGFSRPGPGEDSKWTIPERGSFTLTIIELLSNWGHTTEATEALSYAAVTFDEWKYSDRTDTWSLMIARESMFHGSIDGSARRVIGPRAALSMSSRDQSKVRSPWDASLPTASRSVSPD
jgi:hypothetical protein